MKKYEFTEIKSINDLQCLKGLVFLEKTPRSIIVDRMLEFNQPSMSFIIAHELSEALRQIIIDLMKMEPHPYKTIEGNIIMYNLFYEFKVVREYIKQNYRWGEQKEKNLKATVAVINGIKKTLEKSLGITIPDNSIFKQ